MFIILFLNFFFR